MGTGKAYEMVCFNKKINAEEAKQAGLVADVFPENSFIKICKEKLKEFGQAPSITLLATKRLIGKWNTKALLE